MSDTDYDTIDELISACEDGQWTGLRTAPADHGITIHAGPHAPVFVPQGLPPIEGVYDPRAHGRSIGTVQRLVAPVVIASRDGAEARIDYAEDWATDIDTCILHLRIRSSRPVGLEEIAYELGVGRPTVDQWRTRGVLPEPTWTVGGRPAWAWATIEAWARETGRLKPDPDDILNW